MDSLILQPLRRDEAGVGGPTPDASRLAGLRELAEAPAALPERSRRLYQILRKQLGRPELGDILRGIRILSRDGEPAGARLLAALLDASTPGARLIPGIHGFASSRRLHLRLSRRRTGLRALAEWRRRLRRLDETCRRRAGDLPGPPPSASDRPGHEPPFPLFRRSLRRLVASLYRQDVALSAADRDLLLELARLEIDAYQERISDLSGRVNPYCTASVARLLPRLSRADTEVRDLREFMGRIEAGELDRAFHERRPRFLDIMDDRERERFLGQLQDDPHLAVFADMLRSLVRRPLPIPLLAAAATRLMAVAHQLHVRGLCDSAMDLFTAVLVVQQRERDGEVAVPLPAAWRAEVEAILREPPAGPGIAGWPRDGFAVRGHRLVLGLQEVGPGDRHWRDDLPVARPGDDDGPAGPESAPPSVAELKSLVLGSVESVSVLLGFLRNPQIVAVPGLVADVVRRSRSVLVLETIARDRRLHTGFANRDVPLALLRSPCNVPVKALRKFIHVKHVSKVELQNAARDRAGVRDEVSKEIQVYLRSLV